MGHVQVVFDRRNVAATLCRVGIAPSARGLGIGPAMLAPIIADAFQNHGLQRLELAVYPFNTPAIRLHRRLGFALEGTRHSAVIVDGERWDVQIMGLLQGEWEHHRGSHSINS